MKSNRETIVATATPSGRGGVAIVRVSGPLVKEIACAILGSLPKARVAMYAFFFDQHKEAIDQGIALYFPAPHSFTGEDVIEFQGHGGPVIVDCLIQRIIKLGARLARPGEFSERAFLNNKLDLAQAEAISDLIEASSLKAARSAFRSLQGDFSDKIHSLVNQLIQLRLYVEAAIDFTEEEIDFLGNSAIEKKIINILNELKGITTSAVQGSLLREGIQVVLAGQPNVGKSSLINRLSGKEVAIVTNIPGTTRDVLREHINIDGLPLHIIDTAGLRKSSDPVEIEGIRRAEQEMRQADIVILVVDAREESFFIPSQMVSPSIIVRNKIDLMNQTPSCILRDNIQVISLSAKENEGLTLLKEAIKLRVGFSDQTDGIFSARRRHLDALHGAEKYVTECLVQLKLGAAELVAEELRRAQCALSEITGEFTSDDLLGKIFSTFCIGK